MPPPYTSIAVANDFILRAYNDRKSIGALPLLVFVYFAEGWHYGLYHAPLTNDNYTALFGPVAASLFRELKDFRKEEITSFITDPLDLRSEKIPLCDLDDTRTRNLLNVIWNTYKNKSTFDLLNFTHRPGTPWRKIYDQYEGKIPDNVMIPRVEIQHWFEDLAAEAKAKMAESEK